MHGKLTMKVMIDTKHFLEILNERDINLEIVDMTMTAPDQIEEMEDGTKHYLKQFDSAGSRLHVVVNMKSEPPRRVTAFFDRRLRRKKNENKS